MDVKEWLAIQLTLERESFGNDPPNMEGDALADFVTWNAFALEDELHEFMQEVQWKPWANDRGAVISHDDALKEFVDMLFFLGNLALALRLEPDEISDAYRAKAMVNAQRMAQEGGYDAIGSKCPRCRRNLADAGTETGQITLDGTTITVVQCKACGWTLERSEA